MFKKSPKKLVLFIVGVLLVGNGAVWHTLYVAHEKTQAKELVVAFFDIGQGDAIFIEAPNGNQILVDSGADAKVLQELGKIMPWYDKSLDLIVLTNPDKDHIGGFIPILKRYAVSYALEPGTENKTLTNSTLHELITEKSVEKILAQRGLRIFLDETPGREVVLTVLFPDHDVSKESSNDGSIVARLTYGETEIMLTGDAPIAVENRLLNSLNSSSTAPELGLASDILKVGHHGSKTSTGESFVKAIEPKFAVISSGKSNKYGHPNEETLATLEAAAQLGTSTSTTSTSSIQILRTDQLGTIVMKSDGKEFRVVH